MVTDTAGALPAGRRVSREALFLFLLCTLDMVSSAILFQLNMAVEANPLLRPYAEAGILPFMLVKTLTFAPAVLYLEWLRQTRPAFALALLRGGIACYLAIYLGGAAVQALA